MTTPRDNRVLLCVKAALADPSLVDEYATLIGKKTGIPQFSVSLSDLEKCMQILTGSASFWSKVRSLGFGKPRSTNKPKKPLRKSAPVSSSSSSSSSSDESMNGGLDLGFSEDEQPQPPAKQPVKLKQKKKAKSSEDEESSSESSAEEAKSEGKVLIRKKRLANLVARRRAEKAEANAATEKKVHEAKNIPPTAPTEENLDPAETSENTNGGFAREKSPQAKRVRPAEPPKIQVAAADWNSDFGKVVRQAIDNRRLCPFRTLGLSAASATISDVKKRWTKLCLLLHPDKAPSEWKSVPELVDANQAITEAKKAIETRLQAVAMTKPPRPLVHANPYTLDRGNFGKRRIEIRWNPSPTTHANERVDKYHVFIGAKTDNGGRDQMITVGSSKEGSEQFFVLVEDDQRFAKFFANTTSIRFYVLAANAAGNSDPLLIQVPLLA